MGVVNTTYTFTATDVVTSAKLNNVIDETTFTSSAFSGTTLAINGSGQLRVNASGITSLELADNSVNTAKIADANITQAKIATNVVGKGPAFRAWNSTLVTVPSNTITKLLFQTEDFDTNSNFANSRFTASIDGYYSINASVAWPIAPNNGTIAIYRNSIAIAAGTSIAAPTTRIGVHDIVYLDIGDYLEIYVDHQAGANRNTSSQSYDTYFSGCLIRSL